jgi:hypothetical protein
MLQILCLTLCGLLMGTRADPGAVLRLGLDILNYGELAGPGGGPEGRAQDRWEVVTVRVYRP